MRYRVHRQHRGKHYFAADAERALSEQHYVHKTVPLETCYQTVINGDIDSYIAGCPNKRTNVTTQKNLRRF